MKYLKNNWIELIAILALLSFGIWLYARSSFAATAQRQPKRLIACYVREVQHDVSPEAAVMINDTVVIHVTCRNHPRLEIPAHKWPEEWGDAEVGKRVRFIDYGDGKRWLPVKAGK